MSIVKFDNTSYTIDELEEKYRHFFAPAYEIIIDGVNLTRESVAVSSLSVESWIDQRADSFHMSIENAYDPVKREFRWIDSFLSVGKYVEVKLGYVDKLETVFYGLVTGLNMEYPEEGNPSISVTGMDISFLMMKGAHFDSWEKKKASDVVKLIGGKYGAELEVDDTGIEKPIIEQTKTTDYRFIHKLAEEYDYDFFVVGKTMYFRKAKKSTNPVVSLMYGKNLMSFSTEIDITSQVSQVIVRGTKYNVSVQAQSASVDIIGTNSTTGKDIMTALASYTKEYVYTNVANVQEAQKRADAIMNDRSMDLINGSGKCIGIPEIRAGRYIKLDGLGPKQNQLYYITGATHSLNGSGYVTTFKVRGNAI